MNKAQRKVIAAALVLIVLMGLFPPWQMTLHGNSLDAGYAPFWTGSSGGMAVHVNIGYLLVQWLGVVLVAVGCCCLATRRPWGNRE